MSSIAPSIPYRFHIKFVLPRFPDARLLSPRYRSSISLCITAFYPGIIPTSSGQVRVGGLGGGSGDGFGDSEFWPAEQLLGFRQNSQGKVCFWERLARFRGFVRVW